LEIAIRALNLPKGSRIITTPFTWIATASSIVWQYHRPVFVDIDSKTLNIDPNKIKEYLERTFPSNIEFDSTEVSAILAVHVFSNPCDVERIKTIADEWGLKVIYDGAHSVNVQYKGEDLSKWGDITTHSYHATKLYNCGEGGSIIANDSELAKRIERLRFFGHNDKKEIIHEGTNGKMHEISACIGLANLDMMDKSQEHRKNLQKFYKFRLSEYELEFQKIDPASYNYSYFPIIFKSESIVLEIMSELEKVGIIARRYFYPSISEYSIFDAKSCPISEDISRRIICLPCHDRVTVHDVENISTIIKDLLRLKNI
jgi:dTDP-4-amino-4,6-dideoxygalactose transaminase